ncbi:TPA: hypothetical protein ACF3JG_003343 [Enterobacter hormaechei]
MITLLGDAAAAGFTINLFNAQPIMSWPEPGCMALVMVLMKNTLMRIAVLSANCQSGAWVGTKLLDKNIVTGNTTCSSTAMSVATCPSGKTIASGGWRLTWYGSGNNAPDSSYPRNTTQWVTNSNGDNNCFQSVAMCE